MALGRYDIYNRPIDKYLENQHLTSHMAGTTTGVFLLELHCLSLYVCVRDLKSFCAKFHSWSYVPGQLAYKSRITRVYCKAR
jgi:hypothetical protein